MADEAQECERVADERAHRWLANAELSAGLLRKAEARTDFAQAERQVAERFLATGPARPPSLESTGMCVQGGVSCGG